MSLLFTVQQQNVWLVFDGGHVTRSDTRPRLQRAALAIADFEGAVSSVLALEGSAAHAVALIERRLRSECWPSMPRRGPEWISLRAHGALICSSSSAVSSCGRSPPGAAEAQANFSAPE